ncbi:MAG TPA: TlpA disulfide reductase family protein, partial [Enhygromyxa sp.]|nr:TlpA disulfide reductase family protein [Enhygromyxa sp.]
RTNLVLLCTLMCVAGCPSAPTTTPDEATDGSDVDEPASDPLVPSEPANRAAGDELEATITVAGGGAIQLSSLRGRPVLLEISASWEPGFAEAHALYAELLAAHPELAVIVVVADPDDGALVGLPHDFTPAWDPAGALAAKLSVATFPTMFVLDRAGRISAVTNGWSDEVREQLRSAVAAIE